MFRDAALALLVGAGSAVCTVARMPERVEMNVCLTNSATEMALLGTRERFPDDTWARAHQGPYGKSVALGARECLQTSRVVDHEAAVTVVTNWIPHGVPEGEEPDELTCGIVSGSDASSFELVHDGDRLVCRAVDGAQP
jgi:hypothetical protein